MGWAWGAIVTDDWCLKDRYWPRAVVRAWWDGGWDCAGLETKPCPQTAFASQAAYWAHPLAILDPRVPDFAPAIDEAAFWGPRWRTEFPAGSARFWTPYHLPLYDPDTGALSPKHPDCPRADRWGQAEHQALVRGLKARMNGGERHRNAPLCGIVVPEDADLTLPDETVFVDFSEALFAPHCAFARTERDGADAPPMTFGADSRFVGAAFARGAHFTAVAFDNRVSFADVCFAQDANFDRARFADLISFSRAQFTDTVNFAGARFGRRALFNGCRFGYAYFTAACFDEMALMSHAQFGREAQFAGAVFARHARFTGARFGERGDFAKARFLGNVRFDLGPPSDDPDAAAPLKGLSFRGAEFWGDADFTDRTFGPDCDFTDARFYGLAIFHGARLHESTRLPTAADAFAAAPDRVPPPPLPTDSRQARQAWQAIAAERTALAQARRSARRRPTPGATDIWTLRCIDFEKAYRRLKILMQAQGAGGEDHFFHTLELRNHIVRLDRENVSRTEVAFARLYGLASNYGHSLLRPLIGLGASYLASLGAVWGLSGSLRDGSHAALYALRHALPGLGLSELAMLGPEQRWLDALATGFWPRLGLHLIAAGETGINLVLLFLLALAIRHKFRLR